VNSGETRVGRGTAKVTLLRTTDRRSDTGRLVRQEHRPTEVGSVVPFAGHSTVVGTGVKAWDRAARWVREHRCPRRAQDASAAPPRPRRASGPQSTGQESSRPVSRGRGPSPGRASRRARLQGRAAEHPLPSDRIPSRGCFVSGTPSSAASTEPGGSAKADAWMQRRIPARVPARGSSDLTCALEDG